MIGGIDLFSPSSYASGHPTDQYAWLRNAALFSSRPTIMTDDGVADQDEFDLVEDVAGQKVVMYDGAANRDPRM